MKNKILSFIVVVVLIFSVNIIHSQPNYTMYGMTKMGQSHYENPSNFANGKVYIGILLGNHSFGVNNSGFTLNRILKERSQDDTLVIDQDAIKKSLGRMNYVATDIRNEIFGLGINIKKNYFSFAITHRFSANFMYPKDLIVLGLEGNGRSFLGERVGLDGLGFKADGYMEYAFGYNREINDKWRVGGRLKILSGYANFTTQKSKLGIHTNEENFDVTIDGQMKFSATGINSALDTASTSDELTFHPENLYNFKNFGLALDLGVTYKLTNEIELSASLLDIGFINWRDETSNYETDDVNFKFEGVEVDEYFSDPTETMENLGDSLLKANENDFTHNSYVSSLSSRFYIGGRYEVTDWFTAGITSYNQFIGKRLRMAGFISGTIQLKNWLGFTVNYGTYGRSFTNLGVGLSLRGGPIQFYVMTDNILALNYSGAKNAHAAFGLNLLIGDLNPKGEIRWRTKYSANGIN